MSEEETVPPADGETEEDKQDVKEESKAPTTLDKYQAENARREEILKKEEELQERKEKLHAEQMLGGGSNAGQAPPQKKELSDEEYKDKVMAGEVPEE